MIRCLFLVAAAPSISIAQESIRQTIVPTDPLVPGQTTLWSPALQKGWDTLREMHKVESIDLNPPNKTAEFFNNFQWDSEKALPPHSVVTFVGEDGPKFVEVVNAALRQHFGNRVELLDPKSYRDRINGGLAILTVFMRSVAFNANFTPDRKSPFDFFDSRGVPRKVNSFGSWNTPQQESNIGCARVLAYQANTKLALALKTADSDEFVVLLQDSELKSIDAAFRETRALLKTATANDKTEAPGPGSYTTAIDTIRIPQLQLSHLGKFAKDFSGTYQTPGTPPQHYWLIARALQSIDLSLTHSGADLEVRSFVVAPSFLTSGAESAGSSPPKKPEPRHFIFNKPFFLMFWRKNATVPYLACYIDGGGLVPWTQP